MQSPKKYICVLCGYIYDESLGDPEHGIAAETRWEDIPSDWFCPECGASFELAKASEGFELKPAQTVGEDWGQ